MIYWNRGNKLLRKSTLVGALAVYFYLPLLVNSISKVTPYILHRENNTTSFLYLDICLYICLGSPCYVRDTNNAWNWLKKYLRLARLWTGSLRLLKYKYLAEILFYREKNHSLFELHVLYASFMMYVWSCIVWYFFFQINYVRSLWYIFT